MKAIILVVTCIVSITGSSLSAHARDHHRHYEMERFGHEIAISFVDAAFDGGHRYHHRYYRQYHHQQYQVGYSELEQARIDGYRKAQKRDREEKRWRAEQAYRKALENARRQGEMDYQNRYHKQ